MCLMNIESENYVPVPPNNSWVTALIMDNDRVRCAEAIESS